MEHTVKSTGCVLYEEKTGMWDTLARHHKNYSSMKIMKHWEGTNRRRDSQTLMSINRNICAQINESWDTLPPDTGSYRQY